MRFVINEKRFFDTNCFAFKDKVTSVNSAFCLSYQRIVIVGLLEFRS